MQELEVEQASIDTPHEPLTHLSDKGDILLANTPNEILRSVLNNNPSARGLLQGYIAEEFLMAKLRQTVGVSDVAKIPDRHEKKGDISLQYKGREITIEVKSARNPRPTPLEGGFYSDVTVKKSDRSASPDGVITSCLEPGQFDILAISTYSLCGEWGYYFIASSNLPRSDKFPGKLKSNLTINVKTTPFLYEDISKVLRDFN